MLTQVFWPLISTSFIEMFDCCSKCIEVLTIVWKLQYLILSFSLLNPLQKANWMPYICWQLLLRGCRTTIHTDCSSFHGFKLVKKLVKYFWLQTKFLSPKVIRFYLVQMNLLHTRCLWSLRRCDPTTATLRNHHCDVASSPLRWFPVLFLFGQLGK